MPAQRPNRNTHGPFSADQVREGDPYEVSDGHAIYCFPTGGRGAGAIATGSAVLSSDPAVESSGIDAGFAPRPNMLRAPDIAVGNIPNEPGWIHGAPPLAVEYADTGQDEAELAVKIGELLDAGTQLIWVVRLNGPRRVEIHQADRTPRTALPGEELEAPGILHNRVPVEALYDPEMGRKITLRNLLQRDGYDSLDAVRAEGQVEGRIEGRVEGRVEGAIDALKSSLHVVLQSRSITIGRELEDAIRSCQDPELLKSWLQTAATAETADEILG